MTMSRLLIIDDEAASCRTLKLHFSHMGYEVETAHSADEGLAKLTLKPADVVISDIRMPGRDGFSLLADVQEKFPGLPVIMITAFHDLDSTVAAMHGGAVDYILKPIDIEELETAVTNAENAKSSQDEEAGLVVDGVKTNNTIIGRSTQIKDVFKQIGMVSQSRVTALILGESGTGKELVAKSIHNASPDRNEPFIAINCAALVETLLESEMFGHEKGAFTGAIGARKGKVEVAGEGTLFLDEIAELSPRMQGKLLRLLEEREFTPVGGNKVLKSHARFITATNADLLDMVDKGDFREDLYYRLNVVSVNLPPLRERTGDIPLLVEHLLKKINKDIHKTIRRVPADVMEALVNYSWPGNIRQLENILMKAVVMAQGDSLNFAHLPDEVTGGGQIGMAGSYNQVAGCASPVGAMASLKDLEREHIMRVLAGTGWHKGKACETLGISRPKLERRIQEFNLAPNS